MSGVRRSNNTVSHGVGGEARVIAITQQDVFNLAFGNNIVTGTPVSASVTLHKGGPQFTVSVVSKTIDGRGKNSASESVA